MLSKLNHGPLQQRKHLAATDSVIPHLGLNSVFRILPLGVRSGSSGYLRPRTVPQRRR